MTLRILRLSAFKRHFAAVPLYNERPHNSTRLTSRRPHLSDDFVITPIHYQEPRELVKTVVKGGNYRIANRNFWLRCSTAVIYHGDCFSARELLLIANAFGKVNHHDSVLFKTIADLSLRHASEWRLDELPVLLNAFRACSVFDQQLFQKVLLAIVKNITTLGPAGLAFTLYSLTVTTEFKPPRVTLDALVSPIFNNISQFSIENLNMIAAALAHVNYRNVALLKLLTHHMAEMSDYSRSCYSLLKSIIRLNYVDGNVVNMVGGFVRENVHFMHVGAIPELLELLLSIHAHTRIEHHIYQVIVNSLCRNQESVEWRTLFGVKAALQAIDYSDTYLDAICIRLSELIKVEFTTRDKIQLLCSCKNYPLPLDYLYGAVIASFQDKTKGYTVPESLADPALISDEEYSDLFFIFSELGYMKGICMCLLALDINHRNITGYAAIRHYDSMKRHFNYEDLFLVSNKKGVVDSPLRVTAVVDAPVTADKNTPEDVYNANGPTKRPLITVSHGSASFNDEVTNKEDIDRIIASWNYIEAAYRNAVPMDFALSICSADTLDFMCNLIPLLLATPLEELQPEIIPAMLRRSLLLSQKQGYIPRPVRDLHNHIFERLAQKDAITTLSTTSFVALIYVMDQVDCKLVNIVLGLMIKCCIDRINSNIVDLGAKHLLCNQSFRLLKAGVKNPRLDCTELAVCICINANYIEPARVHHFLRLLVELPFTDKTYIAMLEPVVEKAITIDSNMMRVRALDDYSKKLGLCLKPAINDQY